jgi:hypothetical protein
MARIACKVTGNGPSRPIAFGRTVNLGDRAQYDRVLAGGICASRGKWTLQERPAISAD